MHYLARGVYNQTLLLLGAYRDTDIDEKHPLSPVLTELNRERLLQSAQIKRMSLNDVSEMIKHILEQDEVPEEFFELVYEKTRGNPFFVEEVLKSLKEEEIIYREKDKWRIKEVSTIEFPKTVKSVIKKRVSRLDDECQNLLTLASFIGKDFSFEALCGVTGIEENKLLEIMERILKAELIKEKVVRGQDLYCFGDVIVRDVIHGEVSHLRHKKLHGDVGRALEKAYAGKIDEHLGELAHHFLEGGDKGKALDYFLKAGERAEKVYAPNEAFSYFQHALELLEEQGNGLEKKARIIEKLGDFKGWMGEPYGCLEYWNKALALWDQLGDKRNVARIHVKLGSWLWLGGFGDKDKASEHHRMALEILEKGPESVELASLYEDISHMLWRTGKSSEALTWTQKALSIGEDILALVKRVKYTAFISSVMGALGICYRLLGEWDKSLKYQMEALDIGKKVGEYQQSGSAASELGELFIEMKDYEEAEKYLNEGNSIYEKPGDTDNQMTTPLPALSRLYLEKGEIDKATELIEKICEYATRTKSELAICDAELLKAMLFRKQKNWEQSIQHFEKSLQEAKSLNAQKWHVFQYAEILYEYGIMYLERNEEDDREKAYSLLDQALMIYRKADSKKRIEKVIAKKKLLTA
jgi:tetratricopeptide (TPR) repeat protein